MHPIPKRDSSILQDTGAKAIISRGYSSEETCSEISLAFKNVFDRLELYRWQLDICEALLLGLDCIAIAGTGFGKTMPFIMPLLVDPTEKGTVIIILPLNALKHDQATRFNKIGLHTTAVNRDVWMPKLEEHKLFSKLMRLIHFTKNVLAIVINEAYCVSQWGNVNGFRKYFGELGQLCYFVPTSVPFLATSATLPPHVLSDVTH
ncbi:P-loop containing nucleoside triphosphate hydrolase protein [Russula dissimulans]|nr:P-loop containing nucleoside triphosphate hydrolase protein [Russula dissimulans]